MDLYFSVIIPTYNRRDALLDCLDHLSGQSMPGEAFEVIVCDDGSTDETVGAVKSRTDSVPFSLKLFIQDNRGPAAARNACIRQAKGGLVVFMNDDAVAQRDTLEKHFIAMNQLDGEGKAVVGAFPFMDELAETPFGYILQHSEALFSRLNTKERLACGYEHFYTCNASIPRRLLDAEPFDPAFKAAAAEDIDLGYRLQKKGVQIYADPACVCRHNHPISPEAFCRINETRGYWAGRFFAKHVDLEKRPCFSDELMTKWQSNLNREATESKQALRRVEIEERAHSMESLPHRALKILSDVEFLHQYHYERGLAGSSFVHDLLCDDHLSREYNLRAVRRLHLKTLKRPD